MVVAACLIVAGCNSGSKLADGESTRLTNSDSTQTSSTRIRNPKTLDTAESRSQLAGIWHGVAILDQQKLQNKLAQVKDSTVRDAIELMANSFSTMRFTARYAPNGVFSYDITINQHADSSKGTWKIVTENDQTVTISIKEELRDGSQVSKQDTYQYIGGFNKFRMDVPVAVQLRDLDCHLLFQRQLGNGSIPLTANQDNSPKGTANQR